MLKFERWSLLLVLGLILSLFLTVTGAFAQTVNSSNTSVSAEASINAGILLGASLAVTNHQAQPSATDCSGYGNCGSGCNGSCGDTWIKRCSYDRVCHYHRVCAWSFTQRLCHLLHWCSSIRECLKNLGWGGGNNWGYAWGRPRN